MQDTDPPSPVSTWRLKSIRRYIAKNAPFAAVGHKIVVDEKAVDHLLPRALKESLLAKLLPDKRQTELSPEKTAQLKKILMKQFNDAAGTLPFDGSELKQEADDPKRTLIMAPPTKLNNFTEHQKMRTFTQWLCLQHALVKAGAHLETIASSPDTGGVREVYTRDRYLMINGTAYLPDPQKLRQLRSMDRKHYEGEVLQVQKALQDRGVRTQIVKDAWFEGGNVVRHFGSRTIFVGMDGEWSSAASAKKLVDAINANERKPWAVVNVPLTNFSEMYHTDTGMSEELPHGEIMLSDRLTDARTYKQIISIVGAQNVIHLDRNEARLLATNFIDVGDTLVLTGQCDSLKKKLAQRGYTVVTPHDYNQPTFEFGGGGVHCMTNDVPQNHRCAQRRRPSPGMRI